MSPKMLANSNLPLYFIYEASNDDGCSPDAKPMGMLDDEDWLMTETQFIKKYTRQKIQMAQVMMFYQLNYVRGMSVNFMRRAIWLMIEEVKHFTGESDPTTPPSAAAAAAEAPAAQEPPQPEVESRDARGDYDPVPMEFRDFLTDVPKLFQSSFSSYSAAGVETRSKRVNQTKTTSEPMWTVQWGVREFTIIEWNAQVLSWESRYPVVRDNAHGRGGDGDTGKFRTHCWDLMDPVFPSRGGMATRHSLPEWFCATFKTDIWGNVLTLDSRGLALCSFDVDHAFPYSLGGKTTEANLIGCHHAANREVKSNFILQTLSPKEMLCGISAEQLKSVAQGVLTSYKKRGHDVLGALWRLVGYLTTPPGKGKHIGNFQKLSEGSKDAGKLLRILRDYHINGEPDLPM